MIDIYSTNMANDVNFRVALLERLDALIKIIDKKKIIISASVETDDVIRRFSDFEAKHSVDGLMDISAPVEAEGDLIALLKKVYIDATVVHGYDPERSCFWVDKTFINEIGRRLITHDMDKPVEAEKAYTVAELLRASYDEMIASPVIRRREMNYYQLSADWIIRIGQWLAAHDAGRKGVKDGL